MPLNSSVLSYCTSGFEELYRDLKSCLCKFTISEEQWERCLSISSSECIWEGEIALSLPCVFY